MHASALDKTLDIVFFMCAVAYNRVTELVCKIDHVLKNDHSSLVIRSDNVTIDLYVIELNFLQQLESGETGTEIVDRDDNTGLLELLGTFFE